MKDESGVEGGKFLSSTGGRRENTMVLDGRWLNRGRALGLPGDA
jgi:hypothetical protein